MLTPESVQVPAPCLVTVPLVVPMMLAMLLAVLVPSSVNPKLEPVLVIVPAFEITMPPGVATMLLGLPRVIRPL